MTMRETATQAMKELGWDETRINAVLDYMDKQEPELVEESNTRHIDPRIERPLIDSAKDYFTKNHALPMDN